MCIILDIFLINLYSNALSWSEAALREVIVGVSSCGSVTQPAEIR